MTDPEVFDRVLLNIVNRAMPEVVRVENHRALLEIIYPRVWDLTGWANWRSASLDERAEWMSENLPKCGFDKTIPNVVGFRNDDEATIFKTVWR